jgi:hypothetical protein
MLDLYDNSLPDGQAECVPQVAALVQYRTQNKRKASKPTRPKQPGRMRLNSRGIRDPYQGQPVGVFMGGGWIHATIEQTVPFLVVHGKRAGATASSSFAVYDARNIVAADETVEAAE